MSTCHIIGAAPVLSIQVTPKAGDFIIAADGGYLHLKRLDITPDIVLGDFDSLPILPTAVPTLTYPKEKDDTDMILAIKFGLEKGYHQFCLYGGLGGRLDHTIANLQALTYLSHNHARGTLIDEATYATAITADTLHFDDRQQGTISIFAQDEKVEGVTLDGLRYPLHNATLTNSFPLGVSNQFMGIKSSITVQKGTILVIWERCMPVQKLPYAGNDS